jgi:D-3-phosphoglycerate dehydrogenase
MKVLITPRSFAKNDSAPVALLEKHGIEIVWNTTGGILSAEEMKAAIADCDGVIIGVDPLDADVLASAPKLKAVSKYGVGVDNIDLTCCGEKGIPVARTVGANSDAVADYAFTMLLALARKIVTIDRQCREGDWAKITTSDVSGKRLGLIGLGAIGRRMVSRAKGFNMEVWACDAFWNESYAAEQGVREADIDTICRECDFISLHLPLNEDTKRIIDEKRLKEMKPSAFLINTARGGLIDDDALLKALRENKIAGAGLDVFAREPPEDPAWFSLPNVVIGSHCAASTIGASQQMSLMAAQNLLAALGYGQCT